MNSPSHERPGTPHGGVQCRGCVPASCARWAGSGQLPGVRLADHPRSKCRADALLNPRGRVLIPHETEAATTRFHRSCAINANTTIGSISCCRHGRSAYRTRAIEHDRGLRSPC